MENVAIGILALIVIFSMLTISSIGDGIKFHIFVFGLLLSSILLIIVMIYAYFTAEIPYNESKEIMNVIIEKEKNDVL